MHTARSMGEESSSPPAVDMRGIVKRFGTVIANDSVDFSARRGEIHSLLGENGAGKSTLVKILFGLYRKDAGDVRIDGRSVEISNPAQAISLGIGMVHQHFMLIDRLTVAENLIAGIEPKKRGLIDLDQARRMVIETGDKYGLAVDPDARVEDLSVGEQQRVEILKSLMRDADILILDEPTAVLTPQEVDDLFRVMQHLKERGKATIFITHKLRETMAFSDRVTVLRNGTTIGTVRTSETGPEELAEMMVGRKVILRVERPPAKLGDVLLELEGLTLENAAGHRSLDQVDLQVRAGEILGIAGVEGNGQLELEEVITGLRRPTAGVVRVNGRVLAQENGSTVSTTKKGSQKVGASTGKQSSKEKVEAFQSTVIGNPRRFRQLGGSHIPSDRLRRGLVPTFSLARNSVLGRHRTTPFARQGLLQKDRIRRHAEQIVKTYRVRTESVGTTAASLSGGNQQKLIIGRELSADPQVIIAAQPTRGVDVGAIEQIHQELLNMRAEGKAILLISAELDELLSLSDRLAVIYEGRIVVQGATESFTETELGLWMAGEQGGKRHA